MNSTNKQELLLEKANVSLSTIRRFNHLHGGNGETKEDFTMGTLVKNATDQTFKENVLTHERPALVDFWASWCGPCKALSPVIDSIAQDFENEISVFKVNVDDNPNLARTYNIQSIPTMILFIDGKERKRIVGSVSKSTLAEFVRDS